MKDNQERLLSGKNFNEVMKDIALELKSLKVTDSEMDRAVGLFAFTTVFYPCTAQSGRTL